MIITPNMSLFAWTSTDDDFDHTQLATNFQRADSHDHTPGKGVKLDGTAAIIAGSITTASLADGSVTGAKIAAGAITGTNIADGSITDLQIAVGTITGDRIASGTTLNVGQVNSSGEGIFILGVQSGDGTHANGVLSYGGFRVLGPGGS